MQKKCWGWTIKIPLPSNITKFSFSFFLPTTLYIRNITGYTSGKLAEVWFTSFQSVFMILGECLTYVHWPLHKRLWKLFPFSLIRACRISGFWAVNFLLGDRWAYVVEVVVLVDLRSWSFCTFQILSQAKLVLFIHTEVQPLKKKNIPPPFLFFLLLFFLELK